MYAKKNCHYSYVNDAIVFLKKNQTNQTKKEIEIRSEIKDGVTEIGGGIKRRRRSSKREDGEKMDYPILKGHARDSYPL